MALLNQYIQKSVLQSILLAVFVLLGVQIFLVFIEQLADIGVGNYHWVQASQYVFLTLPFYLFQFFPMAALLGSLWGLGSLAARSELIVMRSAGFSVWQIIMSVLQGAFFLIVIAAIIGEGLGPYMMRIANLNKIIAKTQLQALPTDKGLWVRDQNAFIYIEKNRLGVALEGITQYTFDSRNRLDKVSYAEKGDFKQSHWWLKNVSETQFDYETERTHTSKIDKMLWSVTLHPEWVSMTQVNVDVMSLPQLKSFVDYRKQNGLSYNYYQLLFWQRAMQPMMSLLMILLAVPFILGPLRSVTMGFRLMVGTVIGFLFYVVNQFLGIGSLVYGIPPMMGAILPCIIFLFFGMILIYRIK
jgi:lipopolysaccharide export system permease protein